MARPKGSGNVFRHGDNVHQITRGLYGTVAARIAQRRKEHILKGCHVCMKEAEDRLYGKPAQEIKQTGHKQPPLILVKMGDVNIRAAEELPALPEGIAEAIEAEVVEEEAPGPEIPADASPKLIELLKEAQVASVEEASS